MLRGRPNRAARLDSRGGEASDPASHPTGETPYAIAERPLGIRFYWERESFFYPYALLQSMRFTPEKLVLSFTNADVVVTGDGLHEVYVLIANQAVAQLVKQGPRSETADDSAVFIEKIEELVR